MKHPASERIAARLRRLRDRFGAGVHARHVDHDQDHLTSTRRDHVGDRTFFLGEIWWVERPAMGDYRPHRAGSNHLPGLVTRRQESAGVAVECAPAGRGGGGPSMQGAFEPRQPAPGLYAATVFHVLYRRPVARTAFGAPIGKLSGADVQRLAAAVQAPTRPASPAPMP